MICFEVDLKTCVQSIDKLKAHNMKYNIKKSRSICRSLPPPPLSPPLSPVSQSPLSPPLSPVSQSQYSSPLSLPLSPVSQPQYSSPLSPPLSPVSLSIIDKQAQLILYISLNSTMKSRIQECTALQDIGTYKTANNRNYGEEPLGRF